MIRSPSLGACNYPNICHSVFTDQSIFSLNLSQIQIPNCNHKHGLILVCRHDVNMFTQGRIVLSSPKRAHVNWNWAISWEKCLKIDKSVKCCCIGLSWELQAPSDGLLL